MTGACVTAVAGDTVVTHGEESLPSDSLRLELMRLDSFELMLPTSLLFVMLHLVVFYWTVVAFPSLV